MAGKIPSSQEKPPRGSVRILKVKTSEGMVCLRVAMSAEFYNELHEFLKQKGYVSLGREKEGLAVLLEFGLSGESREDLERSREELRKNSSRYAALSFQTSEYYVRNFEIVKGLNYHLRLNRELKRELKEKFPRERLPQDEWDNWDDDFVDKLYRRYVFGK